MSGGGSSSPTGGGTGGGSGTPNGSVDCSNIAEQTSISSPKADVLSKLKVGDILAVDINGQGTRKILVVKFKGKEAGSISTFAKAATIIDCIENGFIFTAKIVKIQGGAYTVTITSK